MQAGVRCDEPPNGLRVSCAAPIERESYRVDSNPQKSYDLGAALRRQLHALVGPPRSRTHLAFQRPQKGTTGTLARQA
jgi:hypothetical protein